MYVLWHNLATIRKTLFIFQPIHQYFFSSSTFCSYNNKKWNKLTHPVDSRKESLSNSRRFNRQVVFANDNIKCTTTCLSPLGDRREFFECMGVSKCYSLFEALGLGLKCDNSCLPSRRLQTEAPIPRVFVMSPCTGSPTRVPYHVARAKCGDLLSGCWLLRPVTVRSPPDSVTVRSPPDSVTGNCQIWRFFFFL